MLAGPNGSGKSTFVAGRRDQAIQESWSFIAETVFSHPSEVDLVHRAVRTGYQVELHAMLMPEELAVAPVGDRVARGGQRVPETKIRERYRRLWPRVAAAVPLVHRAVFSDNSRGRNPFSAVAVYGRGRPCRPSGRRGRLRSCWPRCRPPADGRCRAASAGPASAPGGTPAARAPAPR